MYDDAALWPDQEFALTLTLSQPPADPRAVLVSLTGALGIAHVEELAACADRVCALPVRNVRLELSGMVAVDEPGARTLAAACQCLRLNGRRVDVCGVRPEVSRVLDQLGLVLGERPAASPRGLAAPA